MFLRLTDAAPPQSASSLGPVSTAFLTLVLPAGVVSSELDTRCTVFCSPSRRLAADPASTSPGDHLLPDALENYSPLATGPVRRKPLAATWLTFVWLLGVIPCIPTFGTSGIRSCVARHLIPMCVKVRCRTLLDPILATGPFGPCCPISRRHSTRPVSLCCSASTKHISHHESQKKISLSEHLRHETHTKDEGNVGQDGDPNDFPRLVGEHSYPSHHKKKITLK